MNPTTHRPTGLQKIKNILFHTFTGPFGPVVIPVIIPPTRRREVRK